MRFSISNAKILFSRRPNVLLREFLASCDSDYVWLRLSEALSLCLHVSRGLYPKTADGQKSFGQK
jgi:hypothetical protein